MLFMKPLQFGIPVADSSAVPPAIPNSVKEYTGPSDLLTSLLLNLAAGRPKDDAVKLKHPRSPFMPIAHGDHGRYLHLTKLPVNEHANTVLVAKLEFDRLPAALGPTKDSGASIL
jgi:hypothetical protein